MDITRLPVAPLAYPVSARTSSPRQPTPVETAARPDDAQARTRERRERVVQGELLHRERAVYQSTRSFIDERSLDQALPAGDSASLRQSRVALGRYISNIRPEPIAELTQGRSVNLFV